MNGLSLLLETDVTLLLTGHVPVAHVLTDGMYDKKIGSKFFNFSEGLFN